MLSQYFSYCRFSALLSRFPRLAWHLGNGFLSHSRGRPHPPTSPTYKFPKFPIVKSMATLGVRFWFSTLLSGLMTTRCLEDGFYCPTPKINHQYMSLFFTFFYFQALSTTVQVSTTNMVFGTTASTAQCGGRRTPTCSSCSVPKFSIVKSPTTVLCFQVLNITVLASTTSMEFGTTASTAQCGGRRTPSTAVV